MYRKKFLERARGLVTEGSSLMWMVEELMEDGFGATDAINVARIFIEERMDPEVIRIPEGFVADVYIYNDDYQGLDGKTKKGFYPENPSITTGGGQTKLKIVFRKVK